MVKIFRSVAIHFVYQLIFYFQVINFIGSHFRLVETACRLPNNLNEFGLRINNRNELRKYDRRTNQMTNKTYVYNNRKYDKKCNELRYDRLGALMTEEIYNRMKQAGLKKVYLNPNDLFSPFVFATRTNFSNSLKVLILIHGNGETRAGQWSRRLIINHSLNKGSQLPYIKQAKQSGWDILVMNTNDRHRYYNGRWNQITGSATPEQHASYVWNAFITPARNLGPVSIVAHSYGGVVTLELARSKPNFHLIVNKVAFTDSIHSFINPSANYNLLRIFKPIAVNWVHSIYTVNTPLQSDPHDIYRISAGHDEHEWTSWAAKDSVFKYIDYTGQGK